MSSLMIDLLEPTGSPLESEPVFVTPEQFVELLTSHAALERVEGLPGNWLGIRNVLDGSLYMIESWEWARFQNSFLGNGLSR